MKCPFCSDDHSEEIITCPNTEWKLRKACSNQECSYYNEFIIPIDQEICPCCGGDKFVIDITPIVKQLDNYQEIQIPDNLQGAIRAAFIKSIFDEIDKRNDSVGCVDYDRITYTDCPSWIYRAEFQNKYKYFRCQYLKLSKLNYGPALVRYMSEMVYALKNIEDIEDDDECRYLRSFASSKTYEFCKTAKSSDFFFDGHDELLSEFDYCQNELKNTVVLGLLPVSSTTRKFGQEALTLFQLLKRK